jgi:small subunit ribosomal protein S6
MVRKYETLYILKHDSPPEKTEAAKTKFRDILAAGGALLVKEDVWGKKKLAFEIKKHSKGVFVLLVYLAEPEVVSEVERNLKINSEVIRYLTVKVSDHVDLAAEQAEKEKWEAELGRRAAESAAKPEESEEDEDKEKREPPPRRFRDEDEAEDEDDEDEESGRREAADRADDEEEADK